MEREHKTWKIEKTQRRGHARDLARQASQEGWAVVAIGGDGTINEIGSALIGTQTPMGIIPKGSGNGLATELGIPKEPEAACKILLNSKILNIDAGQFNDRYFINMAGIGLDARVALAFDRHHKRGILPYYYLTLRELFCYQAPPIAMKINGGEQNVAPLLIAIGNGQQYGNGAKIAPQARLNDGLFHVTLVPKMSFWKILANVPSLFDGTVGQKPPIESLTAKSLIFRCASPIPYHLDGEPFCDTTEMKITLLPKALKLLVPENYQP